MPQTWFISDTHFNHANIIRFCNRPFRDVDHMNQVLIKNWNERVKDEDTVFFLGDFCFTHKGSEKAPFWFKQLQGNIIFIRGNHDNNNGLTTHIHSLTLDMGGQDFELVHNPDHSNGNHMIKIVGHVHNEWKFKTEEFSLGSVHDFINVGVDQWGFKPITFNEMMKEYRKWVKTQQ